jgi:hypothetical protein
MRRTLIALALASSLGTSSTLDLFDPLWTALSGLWRGAPVAKAGCGADPSGLCKTAPTTLNAGCGMDPDGRCKSLMPQREEGCGADPSGQPKCL